VRQGYWYFCSLGHLLAVDNQGRYLLSEQDFEETLAPLEGIPGTLVKNGLSQLRSHQQQLGRLRWPLTSWMIDTMNIELVAGFRPLEACLKTTLR